MSQEHVANLVKQFGADYEIDGLTLDENGYCCLMFDEIVVNLEAGEDGQLFLYANVGTAPEDGREGFFQMLLEANYLYKNTAGGVIGYDAEHDIVLLTIQTPGSTLEKSSFETLLENFVNVAATWTQRVSEYSEPTVEMDEAVVPTSGVRV